MEMRNDGKAWWYVVTGVIAGAMALMLAGCGSGNGEEPNGGDDGPADDGTPPDDGTTDDAPRCGDGRCAGPTAATPEDCASCPRDCGCGAEQACLLETQVCGNPLIDAIPGTWDLLEVDGGPPVTPNTVMLWTDTSQPLCGYLAPPGDACVRGFSGPSFFLLGTRLYIPDDGGGVVGEGQVLNGGTRIEYDYSIGGEVVDNDVVWVKRP